MIEGIWRDLGDALAMGGVIVVGLGAYIHLRMLPHFATKEELNGVGGRVDSCEGQLDRLETLAESNERRIDLADQSRASEKELLTVSIVDPVRRLGEKFDSFDAKVSTILQDHGIKIEAQGGALKGMGREIGDLKGRVDRLEDRGR